MAPIHTIMHPTDFSAQSGCALRLACSLARDYGAHLIILHVADEPPIASAEGIMIPPTGDFMAEARADLEQLELPDAHIRAERRLERGDPVREILHVADDVRADLIVMGTHGRTGLARLLMGSVAEQVVRQASCPVLTLKTPVPEEVTAGAGDVVAAGI
jgi:nucleotide-binding universal stress UspA family protein